MADTHFILLGTAVALVALLYSSVGHAGASGYIAVLTLAGVAAAEVKPTALTLNILVASIGSWQFWRAGHFSWKLFWPFALLSVPAAFWGGELHLPLMLFKPLLGAVLWLSAARLCWKPGDVPTASPPSRPVAIGVGAVIGFLSGLTGTGGGIFLTPLLLFMRWARTKEAAAASAAFILVNSISGLAGHLHGGGAIPAFAWKIAGAAVAGGAIGSRIGSTRLPARWLKVLLGLVLLIAGAKLIFTK